MPDAEITAERLTDFVGCPNAGPVAAAMDAAAQRFDISTPLRVAHFMSQTAYESQDFTRTVENLNYSAERLCVVWPSRFPNVSAAAAFAHNPEALANRVYANRLGNTQPGDGFQFRGRGYLQITGRANYAATASGTGLPLLEDPDLLAQPTGAALSAGLFWSDHGLNAMADRDDIEAITRRVNGGLTGLSGRQALLTRAKAIWPA